MNKPLKPGCLALVIHGEEAGMVVTCLEYRAPGFRYLAAGTIYVMRTTGPAWITEEPDGVKGIRDQSSLMRIDDDNSLAQRRIEEATA